MPYVCAGVMDNLVDETSAMSLSEQQRRESATSGETSAGGGETDSAGQEGTGETFRKACEHYSRGCSLVVHSKFSLYCERERCRVAIPSARGHLILEGHTCASVALTCARACVCMQYVIAYSWKELVNRDLPGCLSLALQRCCAQVTEGCHLFPHLPVSVL